MFDTLLVALKAGAFVARHFLVALGTVVHLHPIPGMFLVTCGIRAPDIPAVLGKAIEVVRFRVI